MATTQILPRSILSVNIGTSSIQVAPLNLTRNGLFVFNSSATNPVWISPGDNLAVVNGAGAIQLLPLTGLVLGNDFPFSAAMNAVSTGSTPLTIWEF